MASPLGLNCGALSPHSTIRVSPGFKDANDCVSALAVAPDAVATAGGECVGLEMRFVGVAMPLQAASTNSIAIAVSLRMFLCPDGQLIGLRELTGI
jgi:hypothetical protein